MKNLSKVHDLKGQKFGRLTVLDIDKYSQTRKTYWVCECECGNIKAVRSDSLLRGAIRSCGCLKKQQDKTNLTANHKHKQSGTRLYNIWQGIKARCYNEHELCYNRYGGRGIKVCEEWKTNFTTFYDWAIKNGYSENLTIDRINVDGDYCPENCRWATIEQQCNNRRSNIEITIGNATKTLKQWCEIFGLNYGTVCGRYHRNGFIGIDDLFHK